MCIGTALLMTTSERVSRRFTSLRRDFELMGIFIQNLRGTSPGSDLRHDAKHARALEIWQWILKDCYISDKKSLI